MMNSSRTRDAAVETTSEQQIRAALNRHWTASATGALEAEHDIYQENVICDYPQSGERIHGRSSLQNLRGHHPAKPACFTVLRLYGYGNLWVTEYIITYTSGPVYTVSIMEFCGVKVAHETQYFAEPFEAPAWRAQWVELLVGNGEGVWSWLHIEDAAMATVAAAEQGNPGIYLIANDQPLAVREWLPAFAQWLHAPPPPQISVAEALKASGADAVYYGTRMRGISNAKAKRYLNFQPRALEWIVDSAVTRAAA